MAQEAMHQASVWTMMKEWLQKDFLALTLTPTSVNQMSPISGVFPVTTMKKNTHSHVGFLHS